MTTRTRIGPRPGDHLRRSPKSSIAVSTTPPRAPTGSRPDTLDDLRPPPWRFQIEGPGAAFCQQLRSIAEGPVQVEVVRTLPASSGFVTEHVETQRTRDGDDGQICAVTTPTATVVGTRRVRTRHAAEAPMIRP